MAILFVHVANNLSKQNTYFYVKPVQWTMEQHAENAQPTPVICSATLMDTAMYVG
jgi:hypothetical protein